MPSSMNEDRASSLSFLEESRASLREIVSLRQGYFCQLADRLMPGEGERPFAPRDRMEARLVAELAGLTLMQSLLEHADALEAVAERMGAQP